MDVLGLQHIHASMQKSPGDGCCNYGQAAVIEMVSDLCGVGQQARHAGSNGLINQVSSLKQELSAEQALRNGLESKVNELETENKALKEEIDHHEAVTDCVLPFVRDHHAVAIRTLLDVVLDNLKWDGRSGREDFVRLRQPAVEALFDFKFSAGEIGQIVR
jgi:outer membrane murein-binding lipoprotein Lpp